MIVKKKIVNDELVVTFKVGESDYYVLRNAAEVVPVGNPGDCDGCGEWFGRLVDGYCGYCRDKLRIG